MHLCLIHTADLHHRLTTQQANRLASLKVEREALLLDCGDAISAPNICAWPWPERAIRLMNQAGYDAMCVGNREYNWRRQGLLRKTGEARFPVLSANILPKRGELGHLQRWTVLTTQAGLRVGLFGLTEVMITAGSAVDRLASSRFIAPLEAAAEAWEALRPQSDVVIALTHYGRAEEARLIQAVPGLSAVLCGHWHVAEPSLEMVGSTALARTYHQAQGATVLTYDGSHWRQEAIRL